MESKHSAMITYTALIHTAKLVQEHWVDTVNHDGKWTKEEEEEEDSNKALAVSFYPRTEPVKPLEWKALDNRLKPSSPWVSPVQVVSKKGGMTVVRMSSSHNGPSLDGACVSTTTGFLDTFKSLSPLRTKRKAHSPDLTGPSHTNECPSDYAMPQPLFNAA
ncbi:hypothetical protein Tco_1261593 [Tanacetum coccineum]